MKDDDQERIKAYMAAKMAHIKMYNECMNLADGLDVAKFAELVRADEREACAKVCEKRKWVGLTKRDLSGYSPEVKTILEYIEAILKRKNT
jgi:hypothetical protein